jgi:predicted nucleic acid-binding protein
LLTAIRDGAITAILDPLVVHEITYGLPRFAKQMSRGDIAEHLESLLSSRGIVAEKIILSKALQLWRDNPGIGFVDCYLAAKAGESKVSVFTVNVRHLRRLGADVPDPLPAG